MAQPPETLTIPLHEVRQTFRAGKSLWRSWMNAALGSIHLQAPVLDLGAGERGSASYHQVIPDFSALEVHSVDLDEAKNPTKTADLEQGIPYEAGMFRACLALNLFEHLYPYREVMAEVYRVLGDGGVLVIAVPFLVRVHGDPYDFHRYTAYTLERSLQEVGFTSVMITPCGGGAITAALSLVDFAVPRLLRGVSLQAALWIDAKLSARSGGKYRNAHDYPLGYIVLAQK